MAPVHILNTLIFNSAFSFTADHLIMAYQRNMDTQPTPPSKCGQFNPTDMNQFLTCLVFVLSTFMVQRQHGHFKWTFPSYYLTFSAFSGHAWTQAALG